MSVQWFEFKTAHATLDDLFGWVRVPFGNVWWDTDPRRGSQRQRCGEALERTEMAKGHGLFAVVAD